MNAITLIIKCIPKADYSSGIFHGFGNLHIGFVHLLSLFNGQFLFILKFFGEVLLIFLLGGVIGKLLHLDKEDKSDSQAHS